VEDVAKRFETPGEPVEVLRGVRLAADEGESIAITGPSGSGKSTLLHLIGTLDAPSAGRIVIGGSEPHRLAEPDLARFRNRTIGFVFQDAHLLPQYSVLENVLLPVWASGERPADGNPRARARELLERVGLAQRVDHRPAELSGGERQRAAVARALINSPRLCLCDEPTGSLDRRTAETVADLLLELHRDARTVLVVVTHSHDLAARMQRGYELVEGRCVER
jgi:lipoprotein-releasing system ATP-binding protein